MLMMALSGLILKNSDNASVEFRFANTKIMPFSVSMIKAWNFKTKTLTICWKWILRNKANTQLEFLRKMKDALREIVGMNIKVAD